MRSLFYGFMAVCCLSSFAVRAADVQMISLVPADVVGMMDLAPSLQLTGVVVEGDDASVVSTFKTQGGQFIWLDSKSGVAFLPIGVALQQAIPGFRYLPFNAATFRQALLAYGDQSSLADARERARMYLTNPLNFALSGDGQVVKAYLKLKQQAQ